MGNQNPDWANINIKLSRPEYKQLVKEAQEQKRSAAQLARYYIGTDVPQAVTPDGKPVKWVVVRVEAAEHQRLKETAKSESFTLSEYCRILVATHLAALAGPARAEPAAAPPA